jgi:hypothetical protein
MYFALAIKESVCYRKYAEPFSKKSFSVLGYKHMVTWLYTVYTNTYTD